MKSVELKNIQYKYPLTDEFALDGISYAFEEGKFYGVIGPNGSGKSTLCSLIKGLIPSFYLGDLTGEINIFGKPLADWPEEELTGKIGYLFQNPFTQISGIKDTVFEEIVIGLENMGMEKNEIIDRAVEIIRMIDIYDLLDANPNELSGGQRQRVAFASILAMNADIYVIDEPTSQLDPEGTESVFKIIRSLKEQKKTVILVEHKIELLAEYADEILVLSGGRLIASGSVNDVLTDVGLMERKVSIPQTVLFGKEMADQGKALSSLPITLSDAIARVEERRAAR